MKIEIGIGFRGHLYYTNGSSRSIDTNRKIPVFMSRTVWLLKKANPLDWTIPEPFYPSALPAALSWFLFVLVILGTATLTKAVAKRSSLKLALLLSIPVALGLLVLSAFIGMIITFFIHDI